MFQQKPLMKIDDYFLKRTEREGFTVFCYRFNGYNKDIEVFLQKYYKEAQTKGFLQLGKMPNPTPANLNYYSEIIGDSFELNVSFLKEKLKKWLPRLSDSQNDTISTAVFETLSQLEKQGKNLNILKNIFVKFMCWMYYRFERLLRQLDGVEVPKILYEGTISDYELRMLSVFSKAGCDIVLLQYDGDGLYQKIDHQNLCTKEYNLTSIQPFSVEFSVEKLMKTSKEQSQTVSLYQMSTLSVHTNQWKKGSGKEDILVSSVNRGGNGSSFYTCYRLIVGVEDKSTYLSELFALQQNLKENNRIILSLTEIQEPSPQEIGHIPRKNYQNTQIMLQDLCKTISFPKNLELQKLMGKAFVETLLNDQEFGQNNLSKQSVQAVYLLCWLIRYQNQLFAKWNGQELPCIILLNGCQNHHQLLFLQMLSKLPVDILVLAPDLQKSCLRDKIALEEQYSYSLTVNSFPDEVGQTQMGTVAYHAERDLDQMIYENTGMYRDKQYQKASTIVLKTMYEEIEILWDQELKFRPNFSTSQDKVHLPILFAKVSGVKDGDVSAYWSSVKRLLTADTKVIQNNSGSFSENTRQLVGRSAQSFMETVNPLKESAPLFYKNDKLLYDKIKNHKDYGYGFMREETQDYLLERLEIMLSQKNIKGMGTNGVEYEVISTILTLDKEILRMIQGFDFTKKNPKIIYIHTKENVPPIGDAIIMAYLNLIGFDIISFVPTGYQGIEAHFNQNIMEEHNIGTYLYDLQVPKLEPSSHNKKQWGNKLFRRGG